MTYLNKKTKISVITAVKNGEKYIKNTIESVLSQKGDFELEYIIRDGNSTDNTLNILNSYKDKLIVISKQDGSPQEAINEGLKMATGEISCWLNADDIFLPGTLQRVLTQFEKNKNTNWLYGRCKIIDSDGAEIRKPITIYKNIIGFFYSKNVLLFENYINQPSVFWRTDFLKQIPWALDKKYKAAWDYELWLKMAECSRATHVREYLSCFRRTEGTISECNFEKQFQEELSIAINHGNKIHAFIHHYLIKLRTYIYKLM